MDQAKRVERAYRFLVEVVRALLRVPGEAELAEEICRIAVEVAGYRLAWVGYRQEDLQEAVRVVAQHGFDDGYLAAAQISWREGERGDGPTGRALRTGAPEVAQNIATDVRFAPWRADALARRYASSAALPFGDRANPWGVLNLYAPEPEAFDAEELDLLLMVTADLAFGIEAARGKHELARLQSGLARLQQLDSVARASAIVSHDMNNHLAVALLCLESLKQGEESSRARDVTDARAALERAVALNRSLLDAVRSSSEQVAVFSLDGVIRELAPEWRRILGNNRDLLLRLGTEAASIRMDRAGLERVLLNLVANARDALPHGGQVTLVTRVVRLQHPLAARWLGGRPGEYVSLTVQDDGTGMEPTILPRIFEPFFTTKGERGTGLGLASVYGIVRQAGGLIAVDSELGRGTTFEVLVPVSLP